jgi:hypothetical protein
VRPILAEIHLCHACSCHEMLSGPAAAGHKSWALCTFDSPAAAQAACAGALTHDGVSMLDAASGAQVPLLIRPAAVDQHLRHSNATGALAATHKAQQQKVAAARASERGAAAVAPFLAAVVTEIYLCSVCSCPEILRRNGRGQARCQSGRRAAFGRSCAAAGVGMGARQARARGTGRLGGEAAWW